MVLRLALLALALGCSAAALRAGQAGPGFSMLPPGFSGAALLLVSGWTLVVVGLAHHWRHRRRWPETVLLVGTGAAWWTAELDNPEVSSGVLFTLGLVMYAAWPALLLHAALGYPSGRLRRWWDRLVVLVGYVVLIGLQGLAVAAVFDPVAQGCLGCATNLVTLGDHPSLASAWGGWGVRAGLVWAVAGLVLLVGELVRAGAATRRATGGVRLAAAAALALVAVSYWSAGDRGLLGSEGLDRQLWVGQALALTAVASAACVDLVRERRSQRALAGVVVGLRDVGDGPSLRDTVAQRFGDPELVLVFPVEDGNRYVDAEGRPVEVEGTPATELRFGETHVATAVHRERAVEDPELVEDVVSALHLRLENKRLRAEALAQAADLQDSGTRIVEAGDRERLTIERDLHDGAQQRLVGLALGLRLHQGRYPDAMLDEAAQELTLAIDRLRSLARGLYPALLADAGVGAAVRALAEVRPLRPGVLAAGRFAPVVETTAYLTVLAATANGGGEVEIVEHDGALVVTVSADGPMPSLADLADRVTTLAGTLEVTRSVDRRRVRVVLPL